MYNVTLISTEHRENGKCNSDELYKIIESISPDVIFEEQPNDERYQEYYNGDDSFGVLEIQCIKKYKQNYGIKNIPVEKEITKSYTKDDYDYLFGSFREYSIYKQILKEHCTLRNREGFIYLNSKRCMELFDMIKITEKKLIEFSEMNKNVRLLNIYKVFHKELDDRENAMLQNIYNYSKENQYNKAVFLLGYAHRKSIMQKIIEFEAKETLKINWRIFTQTSAAPGMPNHS